MSLLDDVSIVVTPNAYKAGELYAVIPVPTEGSELLTNYDFSNDLTGWTVYGTTSATGGIATIGASANSGIYQGILTEGVRYTVTVNVTSYDGVGTAEFVNGNGSNLYTITETGIQTFIFTQSIADANLIVRGMSNALFSVSSVSAKEYTSADMDVTRATAATRVDENGLVNYAEVLGSDLVTNGDYTNGLTGWNTQIPSGQIVEVTSNQLHINYDSSQTQGSTGVYQSILTLTKTYKTTIDVASVTGTFKVQVGNIIHTITTAGIKTFNNVASDAGFFIVRKSNGQSFEARINSVSVQEVTRDNVPRIDYTGGGCPHILAEPQRTNLLTYSEDFSQSFWTKSSVTLTTGFVSPDGTTNASKLVSTGADGSMQNSYTVSSGTTYTISVYLKTVSGTLDTTIGLGSPGFPQNEGTGGRYKNITVTNEWQRYSLTSTADASAASGVGFGGFSGFSTGEEVLIWGIQLEESAYPTSYIPTSGSSVTRNQDIFTRDGIGSLINSTEGVLFTEIAALYDDGVGKYYSLSDGTSSNRIRIGYSLTDNSIRALVISQGTNVFDYTHTISNIELFSKIALSYKQDDFSFWIDGVKVHTDTSGNTPTALSRLAFDNGSGGDKLFAKVKQLQVYDTALTDNQLIQLTGEAGTHFFESYAEMAAALTYTIQ